MEKDKRIYEISFLLQDPEGEKAIVDIVTQFQGTITQPASVKAIKLSYPINKHTSAFFGFFQCELPADQVEKINQALRLHSSVIRFLIVTPPLIKMMQPRTSASRKAVSSTKSVVTNELLEEQLAALENESQ